VAERAAEKQASRRATAELAPDPGAEARREEQRAIREIAETAHGVNLDLGAGLLAGLSSVDPADMAVPSGQLSVTGVRSGRVGSRAVMDGF
jgi:hypothetical protein